MRAVIQRVQHASVSVDGKVISKIDQGLLILLAAHASDNEDIVKKLVNKVINLRIFSDSQDKMNLSVLDIKGEILVISQFTLYADCKGGRRPNFMESAPPSIAKSLIDLFVQVSSNQGVRTLEGVFGANMQVNLLNDGPVTIILDTKELF